MLRKVTDSLWNIHEIGTLMWVIMKTGTYLYLSEICRNTGTGCPDQTMSPITTSAHPSMRWLFFCLCFCGYFCLWVSLFDSHSHPYKQNECNITEKLNNNLYLRTCPVYNLAKVRRLSLGKPGIICAWLNIVYIQSHTLPLYIFQSLNGIRIYHSNGPISSLLWPRQPTWMGL